MYRLSSGHTREPRGTSLPQKICQKKCLRKVEESEFPSNQISALPPPRLTLPSKHGTFNQSWFNVGRASQRPNPMLNFAVLDQNNPKSNKEER